MKNNYKFKLLLCAVMAAFTGNSQIIEEFEYTGSMQTFVIPPGVTALKITAEGAQGGNSGGKGAIMQGNFVVSPGETLQIVVGGEGQISGGTRAGGGGGTYVVHADDTPLVIAGGGGGRAWDGAGAPTTPGIDANVTTEGNDGYSEENGLGDGSLFLYGIGGIDGHGSTLMGPDGPPHAGNGGGFLTSGSAGSCGGGGSSYLSGSAGGTGCSGGNGGYGGGGGGGNSGGGGGGGYSGGGGSYHNPTNGGGAGSFNDGTSQVNMVGRIGHGKVTIEVACTGLTTEVSDLFLCSADSLILFAESTTGGTISWDMDVENGVEFQPNMVGTFTFTATSDSDEDCVFSVDITFDESPEYTLTTTDELLGGDGGIDLSLESGIFPFEYDWSADGTGDFDDSQNLPLADAGTYSVTVSHGNGCTRTRFATINSSVSVNENTLTSVKVYPNPATSEITIQNNGTFNYQLTNALGEVILVGTAVDQALLGLSNLPRGNYFILIQNESGSVVEKIIAN